MMKKSFLVLLIAVMAVLCKYDGYALSPCDPGFNHSTTIFSWHGCDYFFGYCWKCTPLTNTFEIVFTTYGKVKTDPVCIDNTTYNEQDLIDYIEANYFHDNSFLNSLCTVVPCGQPPYTFRQVITTPICWEYVWDNGAIYSQACHNNINNCIEAYDICRNSNGEYVKLTVPGYPHKMGNVTCTNEWFEVPKPTELNPTSNCYHIKTICNP